MSPRVAVVPLATLLLLLSGPAFGQIVLPWVEGFEGTSGETYTTDTAALTGATDWAYENTDPSGRLRTAPGAGYPPPGAAPPPPAPAPPRGAPRALPERKLYYKTQ